MYASRCRSTLAHNVTPRKSADVSTMVWKQEVREYAANNPETQLSHEEMAAGMKEMSEKFSAMGNEVYIPKDENTA